MNRLIPSLCLSTLLLACARDAKHEPYSAQTRASGAEHAQSEEARERRQAAREERAEARDERVELKHRGDPDRVASHGDVVPARDADDSEAKRDRDTDHVTPLDQGNGEVDLKLTQKIRQAVMDDDSLSFGAKNVKIITKGGHVTLRGEVNTAAEKAAIYKAAAVQAGPARVTNEIEIDD